MYSCYSESFIRLMSKFLDDVAGAHCVEFSRSESDFVLVDSLVIRFECSSDGIGREVVSVIAAERGVERFEGIQQTIDRAAFVVLVDDGSDKVGGVTGSGEFGAIFGSVVEDEGVSFEDSLHVCGLFIVNFRVIFVEMSNVDERLNLVKSVGDRIHGELLSWKLNCCESDCKSFADDSVFVRLEDNCHFVCGSGNVWLCEAGSSVSAAVSFELAISIWTVVDYYCVVSAIATEISTFKLEVGE